MLVKLFEKALFSGSIKENANLFKTNRHGFIEGRCGRQGIARGGGAALARRRDVVSLSHQLFVLEDDFSAKLFWAR